jgi:hypothetical protein
MKGLIYAGSKATMFQPGSKPFNWVPVGTERVRDGYLCRKRATIAIRTTAGMTPANASSAPMRPTVPQTTAESLTLAGPRARLAP